MGLFFYAAKFSYSFLFRMSFVLYSQWIRTLGQFNWDNPPSCMILGGNRRTPRKPTETWVLERTCSYEYSFKIWARGVLRLFLCPGFYSVLNWPLCSDWSSLIQTFFYFTKSLCFRIDASFAKECIEMLRRLLGALVSIWCVIYCAFCSKTQSTL